jgi:adenine phosphoribosyltransferase
MGPPPSRPSCSTSQATSTPRSQRSWRDRQTEPDRDQAQASQDRHVHPEQAASPEARGGQAGDPQDDSSGRSLIRDIPDFPKPGIGFKDITPLLASPRALHIVLDGIAERFIGEHIDAIVGIEARGFIFGGALAARLNASFVPARKPGKLPAAVDRAEIVTEYSRDALEMHKGSLHEEARVVVVDDVLATGGTSHAAAELVRRQGGYVVGYAFVVELSFLGGREKLLPVRVESCIVY